jgi:signal transduction histidine kinase
MKKGKPTEEIRLRQKAEDLLKKNPLEKDPDLAKADMMMLINELKIHELELEIQNKELTLAKEQLKISEDKLKQAFLEAKQYEKQLLQINADKDKFFSIIAHDLRSPFNSFLGYTKIMAEELNSMSIKEIQKIAERMSKSAINLYDLLDNLLQWTRIKQGLIPYEPYKLSLKDTCQEVIDLLKSNADMKKITINNFVSDDITGLADIYMLKTILRNLISNAIKFTNKGGLIELRADRSKDKINVSIKDNGIGIEPDILSKLFSISQLQSTPSTASEKGTGLGLLLSKEFVEKHGGTIWVDSIPGKGSNFKFTVPSNDNI